MDISIAIPQAIQSSEEFAAYAQVIDEGPFAAVCFGERICYTAHDALMCAAVMAGMTKRVKVATGIVLLPVHNPVILAKQVASLSLLTNGRFIFGVGVGGRKPDFDVARASWTDRGKRFEEMIHTMRRVWSGQAPYDSVETSAKPTVYNPDQPWTWAPEEAATTEPVPPFLNAAPPLYFGGFSDKQLSRAGRLADGIHSFDFVPDPKIHLERYELTRQAWDEAGRRGRPLLTASTFFALGPNAREIYDAGMRAAYGYTEDIFKWATSIEALTEPAAIRGAIKRFEDAGVDEMLLCVAHQLGPEAVSRLADVIG